MSERPTAPRAALLLARALACFHPVGPFGVRFEPEVVEAAARRATGLNDFGDRDYREGLDVLCRSLRQDAALNEVGRLAIGGQVISALITRLLLVDRKKREPEKFGRPLVPPLIVIGLPRSGTTFLHRLLALAHNARPLLTYELQHPIPLTKPDRRLVLTKGQIALFKALAPQIDAKHYVGADEPEECFYLFDASFVSASFWIFAPVYGYLDWYREQDTRGAYLLYRDLLDVFQSETRGSRLTLKAPTHTGNLDALLEAVPEALVVQTHRDPVPVFGSLNSLTQSFFSALSSQVDVRRMAAANVECYYEAIERNMAARERWPGRVFDVRYGDIVADPLATVRGIYDHFALPWTREYEQRLRVYIAERPQGKHGRHTYSLEDFGLSNELIATRFSEYSARYL